jgi:hypothetical protein
MPVSVDYSQKISNFLQRAEKSSVPSCKLDAYYKAAKWQLKSGLNDAAKASYKKAENLRLLNGPSYIDTVENVLKLVKFSILINPDQRPVLLSTAVEKVIDKKQFSEKEEIKLIRGNTCIGYFTKLANCFYRLKDSAPADQYLSDAIAWSGRGDPYDCLRAYKKIAKVCVIGNKKDYFWKIIPGIEAKLYELITYADVMQSMLWRFDMVKVAYKVDRDFGKKMLKSAKESKEINQKNLSQYPNFVDLTLKYQTLEQMMQ